MTDTEGPGLFVTSAELHRLHRVERHAREVMEALERHGEGIVGHLLDTDDNSGEYLRRALNGTKASRPVEVGDRVLAEWMNGRPASPGQVTKFLNTIGDGSRVFSVKIGDREYAFNERDLTTTAVADPLLDEYRPVADKVLLRLREPLAQALRDEGL